MKWQVVEDVDACDKLRRHVLPVCVMRGSGAVRSVCEVDQDLAVAQCRSTKCGMERLSIT
eukprot:1228714-Amphidinium_carterae.3